MPVKQTHKTDQKITKKITHSSERRANEQDVVEHLQAKPYKAEQRNDARENIATSVFFTQQKQAKSNTKSNILGYLILFLITALIATAFIFGFLIMLTAIAVLFPIWLVLRLFRRDKMTRFYR